jgi:hypothetical protein
MLHSRVPVAGVAEERASQQHGVPVGERSQQRGGAPTVLVAEGASPTLVLKILGALANSMALGIVT